jgi:hypothetical protein
VPNRQRERPALARSARTNDPRGLIYEINMVRILPVNGARADVGKQARNNIT